MPIASDKARLYSEGLTAGQCVAHAILQGWEARVDPRLPAREAIAAWHGKAEKWDGYNPDMTAASWWKGFQSALIGQGLMD